MADKAPKGKMRTIKGKSYSRMYGPESMIGPAKEKLIFPHLDIDLEYLPEARKWKNGNTYEITLRVTQRSIREDERSGSAGFDIVGVSVAGTQPVKEGTTKPNKVARRYEEEDADDSDED